MLSIATSWDCCCDSFDFFWVLGVFRAGSDQNIVTYFINYLILCKVY
jgi:hypothetical protein